MDTQTARIVKGLASTDPYDQYFAILLMEESGRTDLLPRLIQQFRSKFSDVKSTAILTVGRLGSSEAAFYTAVLLPLLRDREASIRYDAAHALGLLGQGSAFGQLNRVASEDPNREVRERAGRSARLIAGQALPGDEVPELRVVLFDPYHRGMAA